MSLTMDRSVSTTEAAQPLRRSPLYWAVVDALVMAKRNLLPVPRAPELLIFSTIQPVMFVLLFRYVFGGAINVGGASYVNYLMAGIFVQTVAFGSVITGIGLAEDMQRGLIDRFRSLPMARSAVLTGRTLADLVRNTFTVVVMLLVGLLVGFRPQGSVAGWAAAFGLLLLRELRHVLGRGGDRTPGAERGGGAVGRLHLALPPDLRQQRLRADAHHARPVARVRRPPAGDHRGQCRTRLPAGASVFARIRREQKNHARAGETLVERRRNHVHFAQHRRLHPRIVHDDFAGEWPQQR